MPFAKPYRSPFSGLRQAWPQSAWLQEVCTRADHHLEHHSHGDLPRWLAALEQLPNVATAMLADRAAPALGAAAADLAALSETLMVFHPWRKGPLELAGVSIDTEWRSDWKWNRLAPHVHLDGARVLDIGCGNGYFGWRMLAAGAKLVIGVDPTLLFVMQWLACRHFAGPEPNFVLPLGIEDLPLPVSGDSNRADLDTVFSMGVLYHRRDPVEHLQQIRSLLRPGGRMLLETLVLGDDPVVTEYHPVLIPENRYARMRNVWAVPATGRLLEWVEKAGFRQARLLDVSPTTLEEQRSTPWMRFESLAESLTEASHEKRPGWTVEGYPAPTRAIVVAEA